MIRQKSVIKFFISVLAIILISNSLFATELNIGVHYDNYNTENKNTFGASINITEYITDEFAINATLNNNKNNNYSAYCAGIFNTNSLNFLGGFLFDIRDSKFSPGVILNGDITIFKFITLGANTNFAFSTKNIFENYVTEIESYLTFHCKNQDVSLMFNYSHTNLLYDIEMEDEYEITPRNYSIGGYLDVLALDERSPCKIGLLFGVESYKKTYDESFSVLDLNVGGRFIFDLEKFGFVISGESTVYKIGAEQPSIPFAISFTTRFAL